MEIRPTVRATHPPAARLESIGWSSLSEREPMNQRGGGGCPKTQLIHQPKPDNTVQCHKCVLEADLLSFLVSSAGIADRNLIDSPGRLTLLGDLGSDFRFEAKSIGLEFQPCQHLPAENLVAR